MPWRDFRDFLAEIELRGEGRSVHGADPDLEMGTLTELMCERHGPTLLFDRIAGYPAEYRIAAKPYSTPFRTAIALGLPESVTPFDQAAVCAPRGAGGPGGVQAHVYDLPRRDRRLPSLGVVERIPCRQQGERNVAKGGLRKMAIPVSINPRGRNGPAAVCLFGALFVWLLLLSGPASAASLPKATQEILRELKLNPSILANAEKELAVPADWIEKAKTEGKLRVRGTPDSPEEGKLFFDPFRERYPFIDFDYSGSNQEDRSVKTLMALRAGRVISDVVLSVGGFILEYKKARALDDLRVIPAWKTASDAAKEDPDGNWIGKSTSYWCMAYNTKAVRKADLPRNWEDLVANPKWRGGNLGLANRPQVWALNVWAAHGEDWTRNFLTRLFTEVKPQLRKEGLNLMPQLASAGEFQAALPSSPARTSQIADAGAPVGLVCPEPLPASTASVMILKGSPNIHSSRIFVNWLLSKEGQIAQFAAKRFTPIHKELQRKEFIPFADQVLGKKVSYSNPMTEMEILPKLYDHWNSLWIGKGR